MLLVSRSIRSTTSLSFTRLHHHHPPQPPLPCHPTPLPPRHHRCTTTTKGALDSRPTLWVYSFMWLNPKGAFGSRKETHSSHASGFGADEGTGVSPGVPDAPDYDSDDDYSWKKSDEDATYVEDQGNKADRDTNANLEGRDDVMADVVLPQVQVTQEIKDTRVALTSVNPDGQQQSYSVSSGFVSNMLNPNQDTGVDAIFGQQAEATSLTNIPVTTIVEPSFFAPTNRPPTPNPLVIKLQQTSILTPATTPSSSLQNLPDFTSLFGFDNRLKTLEDNF
ncbi:hypothetical protein Tco_0583342 [Tanacetum coccineum]